MVLRLGVASMLRKKFKDIIELRRQICKIYLLFNGIKAFLKIRLAMLTLFSIKMHMKLREPLENRLKPLIL